MTSQLGQCTIQSPSGITFALPLAGPIRRCLSWCVDAMVILSINMIVGKLVAFLMIINPDAAMAIQGLLVFAITILYTIVCESLFMGKTLGKRILKLRTVDEHGGPASFTQITVRNLLRVVDFLPFFYFLGGVCTMINKRTQRLGDIAAGTIVILERKAETPDTDQLIPPKYNSLRGNATMESRLRRKLTAHEVSLTVSALLRRDALDPTARTTLYKSIADHFKQQLNIPPALLTGVSDEQLLRNIIDALFHK